MTSLFFVVPVRGRFDKTRVCLRQLRRTCDALAELGVDASAAVVGDDDNLETAKDCGFWVVRQQNYPLGRKWNDGYQCALQEGADHVVPLGSDDWVDPILFTDLPGPTELRCSRLSSVVSENGQRISPLRVWYDGGDGVRVMPRNLLARLNGRPAEESRDRAIDTSILRNLQRIHGGGMPPLRYFDASPWQIVDWKTGGDNLNSYESCVAFRNDAERDTWETLRGRYPDEALEEMRKVYGLGSLVRSDFSAHDVPNPA